MISRSKTSLKWLSQLLTLADSAYPSGAHGHSNGLEFAIQSQIIASASDLEHWILHSSMYSIAPLDLRSIAKVYQAKIPLLGLNIEVAAMRASRIQAEASAQIGRSTLRSALNLWPQALAQTDSATQDLFGWLSEQTRLSSSFIQLPLSWAVICSQLQIPLEVAVETFAMMYIKQCLQVSMRLALTGQSETLSLQGALNLRVSSFIAGLDINNEADLELQSSALGFEFSGLGHQNLAKRYFRS